MSKSAVDSNVVLYPCLPKHTRRKSTSLELLRHRPHFSSQTLSEVINVCRKRWKFSKDKLIRVSEFMLENGQLISVTRDTVRLAHTLIEQYQFQYFDALIVASALDTGCNILFSEDMQHELLVDNSLRIINPFV